MRLHGWIDYDQGSEHCQVVHLKQLWKVQTLRHVEAINGGQVRSVAPHVGLSMLIIRTLLGACGVQSWEAYGCEGY